MVSGVITCYAELHATCQIICLSLSQIVTGRIDENSTGCKESSKNYSIVWRFNLKDYLPYLF